MSQSVCALFSARILKAYCYHPTGPGLRNFPKKSKNLSRESSIKRDSVYKTSRTDPTTYRLIRYAVLSSLPSSFSHLLVLRSIETRFYSIPSRKQILEEAGSVELNLLHLCSFFILDNNFKLAGAWAFYAFISPFLGRIVAGAERPP